MNPVRLATLTLTLAALCLPQAAQANTPDSEKLDTLLVMQRQVVRTIKNDPLADKTFGIELNLLRILTIDKQTSFSGGVSLFNISRHAEIALPFFYSRTETGNVEGDWADSLSSIDFTEITQDIHYRHFLGNTQNGFYLSGFGRFAFLSGIVGQTEFDGIGSTRTANHRATEGKFGAGVGLGYRKFSYRGLYWGTSLNIGRYLLGKNDYFRGGLFDYDNDAEMIFDVELFKFGWAF